MRFKRARRARPGVAELVGSVLAIALTIIVGMAAFGWVNGQARVSETQYGQSVGQTVEYLEENFVVPQANYNYPSTATFPTGCSTSCRFASNSLTIYFYNDGNIANQFQQILVYNSSRSIIDLSFTGSTVTDLNNPSGCTCTLSQCLPTGFSSLENPQRIGTGTGSLTISIGAISSVTLVLPTCYTNKGAGFQFIQGDTYFVKVLGIYGNTVTYNQAM